MPDPHSHADSRDELLQRARQHCDARAWETAFQEFNRADNEQPLGVEDLIPLGLGMGETTHVNRSQAWGACPTRARSALPRLTLDALPFWRTRRSP